MKPILIFLTAAATLMAATRHRFLCTDYTQGKVFIVGADGKVEWSYDAPFANDVWQLPNGNLLFNTGDGVKEVTLDKRVIFSYESPSEIYACQRLSNGNTFVGECNAVRLPDGNALIASADGGGAPARVFEVDPNGKTVWEVKGEELPGISLKFMAGLQRLPNGDTVMSNWLGHNNFGKAPHLIEITRDKKVVWRFAEHVTMKTISSVQLLDVPGDAIRGTILH